MWYKVVPLWVWTALTVLVPAQSSPPVITNFLQKDLVNPEDVKAQAKVGFRLPCKATGSNLKWIWKHNGTAIAGYNERPFTLSEDGTLTGSYLRVADSGTYQCFVRDEQTGAVAFSRKLKVAVTVVGEFINPTNVVKKVNLGEPFSYDCPPHEYSYGVVYSWGNVDGNDQHTFARNERRSISSNGTLFIMYLTQEDIDEIQRYKGIRCTISGANSFQRSGTLRLEKTDKDQQDSENSTLPAWFVTPNAEETAVQGRNKTLFCFASGRPSPTITWKKDGELIQQEESSFKISPSFYGRRLSIQNVDKELHEGTYTCEAQNDLNTENPLSFNFRLNVEVPPEWTADPPPNNITIVIEKNGTLECKVTAKPPAEVSWYKNGQLLQSSEHHILDGSSLHLINVNLDDSGVYQCVAVNAHGMIISATWINVAAWKPSFANVQFGPFHLLNEKEAKLPCEPSTGAPAPTYEWFKNNELLTYDEGSRYRLENDGTLVIKEVDKDQDNVNYTCTAKNFKGEDSVTTVPIILVPPSLITRPTDQKIMENKKFAFNCTASGNPTPKITWIKDGKALTEGDKLKGKAHRNHTGRYWCLAENGLNVSANASAYLDVQFAPSLIETPADQTVNESYKVIFNCNATGNPTPKMTWIKDGKIVDEGNTLSFDTKRNDSGKYWCLADNGLNPTVNASATLDVQFPPSLTSTPADQIVLESATATFLCNATGNPAPKIRWIRDGKTVGEEPTLSFLTNRNNSGKYWCLAENGMFSTVNASANLYVQYAPSLTDKPLNKTIIENQEVALHCAAIGNPTPNIKWIKDGKTVGNGEILNITVKRSDSGKYWCTAENGLDVTVNASAYLDVQFPLSLFTTPADLTVIESETATFHCNATGNPIPKITWIKDEKTVGSGHTFVIETKRNHSGKYWCSADNGLDSTVNASANLDVQFAASITTTPTDQTVIESAVATFHCNATGNPAPNITWIKDGETVGRGDTLSFETYRNHSGKYWCLADNGLNSVVNASANLDVQFPPSLNSQPSGQTIMENEEVTFHCNATGNPTPRITWFKDGKTVGMAGTLSFKAKREKSGTYWCSADNGLDITVNTSASLDVQFEPSLMTTPADQTVVESELATFHCNATGNPTPKITWIKDGKTVGKGNTMSFKANRTHSGKYWCSAENGLNSTANASANLDVQFPPTFTRKPSNQAIIEGQELKFHCTATGNPAPKVTWIKDGKIEAHGDTLNFTADRSNAGKYWCSAENGLGISVNSSAYLDVQFAPSLITTPADQTVLESATATFHCNATGNPTPKIKWIKDGKTVAKGNTMSFEVNRTHTGKYWCLAENGLNVTVNTSASLHVQFPPSLTIKPSNQTVIENQEVTFQCTATGGPTPAIKWVKDGKTVVEGDTLQFKANRTHSGKYWCTVENGLAITVNTSAYLDVQYAPSLTTTPADQTVLESATATFHCNATGNPIPKITWIKDYNTVGQGETLVFEAKRNSSGKYWCSAENGLNSTVNASASLDVQFPPSLITKPSNQTLTENEILIFHCAAIGNPVPKIKWIKDGKTLDEGDILTFGARRNTSGWYLCSAENGLGFTANASAYLDVQFLPGITTRPTDQTILESSNATFHCSATGNPTPKITWIKDGKSVATGERLSFEANRNNSGKYWCSANNGLGVAVNASANLDVQFPPTIVTEPSDRTVLENQQVTFHCSATGNPTPVINWIRGSETLIQGDTLTFKVNRNHSGKYWCSAENALNITVNASANLNVLFSPSLTTRPSDKTVLEPANVTFHCNAIGNPMPKISWIKDGEPVASGDTLSIINTKRNQSGKYWCLADNGLNLTANASADLDVQYFPSFSNVPVNQTINEGDTATFQCTATGNPTPKITWLKDGKAVATGNTISFEANRTHSGKYWCSAENGLKTAINASAYLDVQFAPGLTTLPSNITIDEDDEAEFQCIATGNPTPKITWIDKNGKIVGTGETVSFKANRTDSGKYLCLADNGFKTTVNASAYLNVLFPPSFTAKADNKTVKESDEVIFHCTATGNPVPKITWMKNGRTVAQGGTLRFTALRNASGLYSCLVDNGLNVTIKAKTFLDVQYPPSFTIEPSDQIVKEFKDTVFLCNATGNPAPEITWMKDEQTVTHGDTLSFSALKSDSGKYWCLAENGIGLAINASASLDVQYPPMLTTKPVNQTLREDSMVEFHCTATGNPVPDITWIKDGQSMKKGETLSFTVNRNQSGQYWCSADNGFNTVANASAYLDVLFPPSLTVQPRDQTVTEGTLATFNCTATGNPTPKITWMKDGKTVESGDTVSFETNRTHSGKYWCLAENGLNVTVNASASLDVQFSPSINVRPTDKTVTEGDIAAFDCAATGNPTPEITWFKDGKIVGQGETHSLMANRNQSGKYWCSADNGLNISVNASADLDVQFPPSFTTIPLNQTVNEDDQTIFHCAATGNPTPRITWIKDGNTVGKGDPLSFDTKRNHSGEYWCSAENGLGLAINTSAYLDVQFAPVLTTLPTNQTVLEGDNATFLCNASGNPAPAITWFNAERVVGRGETFTIETRKEQSGEYLCVADNGLSGTANASAYLNVQFPPSFVDVPRDQTVRENDETALYCSATGNPTPTITWLVDGKTVASGNAFKFVANRTHSEQYWCSVENGLNVRINASAQLDVQYSPSFVFKPTNETVIEGELAIFSCDATGNPTPKITWIKDGKTVDKGDTISFEAFRNQSGEYWCLAENELNETVNTSAYLDVQFPPSFITTPINQTVQEGDEVTFNCRVTGNPTPTITWLKDGTTVGQGDTLNFKVNRNHTGKYWCTADNGLSVNINASALLDVQFSPSLITRPANKTVIEADQAMFHCEATGNPTPTIKWIRDGETVVSGETLSFETKKNDSGEYWCLADNGVNPTANASAYLDVQFPVRFTSTPVNRTVREGDETTFHCIATGNPTPVITWLKDGKTVATGEAVTLTANRNDSGQYLCSAENGLGVNINASFDLDVQYAPRLFTVPSNMTVIEGAIATFHCNATGNPAARYRWTKDGKTVATGNTLSFQTNRNDSGRYWCLTENGLDETVNASAYLNVQYPLSFTTTPRDQTIVEGEKGTFLCKAIGNPTPKITWHKDGKTVTTGDTLSFTVNRNQSGRYWCSAENGLDVKLNASASLDVQFSSTFTTRPSNKTVVEGATVTLVCEATGNPSPNITWTKDGKTVANGDKLSFETNRTLSGKYWCTAENGLTPTVNASANIDVQFQPSFTKTPVNQTVTEGDKTTFHCTVNGNPVPNIKWVKDGITVGTEDMLTFETNRNDSGKYLCTAENGLDVPINASAQLNVQYPPTWTVRPTNQTVIEAATATFHCSAIGNPVPTIVWLKDGKTVGTGNSLSLKTSRNQSGEYWCSAENELKTVNTSVNLDVQFPPSFTSKPGNQSVKEGDETVFHCTATGNPNPAITWLKDGKTVASGDPFEFTANRNQSGKYWCSAENGLDVYINTSVYLDVQFPPSCTVRLTYQTVIEGNIATFHCDAKGNPTPKITWMKDGMTVGQGNTLSFEANRNQSGYYWCFAQNTFNTTANASSYLDVHFKPERTHLSVDADITNAVKFDSSVKFNCTADSRPAVDEYRFYRDQSLLGSNSTGIYHLQLRRSGSYSCVPVNSAGSGEKATLYIAVKAWKPSFLEVGFGPFYLFKESLARLPCKPRGEPQPSVKWFKDGTAVSYGQNSSFTVETDGTLVINKVTAGDGGTYTCMAQNYLGIANATAPGILLERTKIVVKPQNRTVVKGTRVALSCRATADPSLELRYLWKKDGADITPESAKVQLLEEGSVIIVPDITADEAGVYTCIVFTPDPRGSEDTSSAIVSIQGSPPPPRDLQITDCYNRKTNLSWSPVVSNDTSVTHYLIDQESNHKASVFKLVYNVSSPNITSVTLNLPGWATLRFRIRAASSLGPSRPSLPTAEGICTTSVGIPEKYPANLRGVPVMANKLSITWTPMPKEDWNAPGTYYILKYRKVNGNLQDWIEEKIGDSKVGVFALSNPGYYQLWEFTIKAGNHEGLGPVSPVIRSYSGQNPPAVKPESTQVGTVTDSNVTLFWEPVVVNQGSVDGYKIYYWGESRSVDVRRKRRDVPSSADSLEVLGGNTRRATLTGLKPFTNYNVVVKAFNSAGEGPESATMSFETLEGVPGPPSNVKIIPFGEYLLITWTPPREPNGIITNYQVGSAEYSAVSPESVEVTMETVDPNVFKKLLDNERFETNYVVELRARTSKGWGASSRTTTRTMKKSAPAKPEKPTVVATGESAAFNVMYNFGVGGGYTHEFKVLYRKKGEGEQFQETAWVDHFRSHSTVINDLDFAALYEIKTIGKNSVGTSPDSNITEVFVAGNPAVGKAVGSPMYQSDWFIALIILSGCVFFLLIIVVLVKRRRRRRSSNFRVAEHEKETENEKEKRIEIPVPVDLKPREDWRGRLEEADRESHDSLDEYGKTDAHFTEDGSFIGEISIDKEPSQEEVQHPVV